MTRKGDVRIEPIVVVIIALSVLSIVGFGYYLYQAKQIDFFRFLPSFNVTQQAKEEIQILRYGLREGYVLDYYDGEKWNGFEKGRDGRFKPVRLGDKTIDYYKTIEDFESYYYSWEGGEIYYDERLAISGLRKSVIERYKDYDYGEAPIEILYFVGGSDKAGVSFRQREAEYRLSYSNILYSKDLFPIDKSSNPKTYQQYAEPVREWRDGVLKVSMRIRYIDSETNNEKRTYYCVKNIGNYLIIDLSKPVDYEEDCPIEVR